MNVIVTTPDVTLFVAAVRERLADLSEEEREELVGGLDADMSDWVSERGVESLPEPAAYAAELRTAAGFTPEATTRPTRSRRDGLMAWMDRGAGTWTCWVDSRDHLGLPALATSLRPVWWVGRSLCAVALACEIWGARGTFGFTSTRALLAVVAVLGSVLLGLWWPTSAARRSLLLRLALVALNVFAVAMVPVAYGRLFEAHSWVYDSTYSSSAASGSDGLAFNGERSPTSTPTTLRASR